MNDKEILATENPNVSEVGFADIIKSFIVYTKEILRNWYIVLLGIVLFSSVFVYMSKKSKPQYESKLSFMFSEDESFNPVKATLGSLGLGGGSQNNTGRMLELAKSRAILEMSFFRRVEIDGKDDFMANHLINYLGLHDRWKNDTTGLKDFYFTHADIENFKRHEKFVVIKLHEILVVKNPLLKSTIARESGVMRLSLKTPNETLSIELLRAIFDDLSQYYIIRTVEKEIITHNLLKKTTDSLRAVTSARERSIAEYNDKNRNVILESNKVEPKRMQRELTVTSIIYAESQKNAEMARFMMQSKTPKIQPIDVPMAPINPERMSLAKALFFGIFGGVFSSILFIVLRKMVRDALSKSLKPA
jgi:uncharacterized protein involved in exopolysaccharide biosynthesis